MLVSSISWMTVNEVHDEYVFARRLGFHDLCTQQVCPVDTPLARVPRLASCVATAVCFRLASAAAARPAGVPRVEKCGWWLHQEGHPLRECCARERLRRELQRHRSRSACAREDVAREWALGGRVVKVHRPARSWLGSGTDLRGPYHGREAGTRAAARYCYCAFQRGRLRS
jgi:hypothetical protein